MTYKYAPLFALLLLAGCTQDWNPSRLQADAVAIKQRSEVRSTGDLLDAGSHVERASGSFATLPDRGNLVAYPAERVVRHDGAYTWHRADLSEAHAINAIADGTLDVKAPSGKPLRFRYERHVEHPSGDWTWVGRLENGARSDEIVITFGEKAAFGIIAQPGSAPLRLTIQNGRSWLIETDPAAVAQIANEATRPLNPDYLVAPKLPQGATASAIASEMSGVTAASSTAIVQAPVDLVVGYTAGFAQSLGGQSQAVTRLINMVEITNQAFANSGITSRVNLVHVQPVTYPDNTSNSDTLEKLTGYKSGQGMTTPDAAFNELRNARERYGADLVTLVRSFNTPENGGCGIAWLLGGGQSGISNFDEYFGYSVVSDGRDVGTDGRTYFCREETLAHEIGHNLGSQHDRATATVDGVLKYGVYPYSFGYKPTGAGNFYTVMAYGDSGQTSYRVFSNPRITFCGGYACGVANEADNARSISQTLPIISGFRNAAVVFEDVAGGHWVYGQTHRLYQAGITEGCTAYPARYCPAEGVRRDQMAVFLLRARNGGSYVPPSATGAFADVPTSHWAAAWIEQLARDGITSGCATSPSRFCPDAIVSRAEMAVFLLRAKYGAGYNPPLAVGRFQDVPSSHWAAAWIEKLSSDGVTSGCSTTPQNYCPDSGVSREQMAVFLTKNFGL